VELPCGSQGQRRDSIFWIGPQSAVIGFANETLQNMNRSSEILDNGTLVLEKLTTADAGKYLCLSSSSNDGAQNSKIIDQHDLPFVVVRKDHLKSFTTAIIVSGTFFVTTLTLYLLSEYKIYKNDKVGAATAEIRDDHDDDEDRRRNYNDKNSNIDDKNNFKLRNAKGYKSNGSIKSDQDQREQQRKTKDDGHYFVNTIEISDNL
uniref:Ig-like domain-containing protein n=1 Tax=Romanomermis culicivorax TaxID=13658 RepID=A0A915J1D5_ROMCU